MELVETAEGEGGRRFTSIVSSTCVKPEKRRVNGASVENP